MSIMIAGMAKGNPASREGFKGTHKYLFTHVIESYDTALPMLRSCGNAVSGRVAIRQLCVAGRRSIGVLQKHCPFCDQLELAPPRGI